MSGRFKMSDGDWVCEETDCQNVNFARRSKCNKCGKARIYEIPKKGKNMHEVGEKFAEKSKGLFSAEDWQCSKCGNVNWARRTTCNVCNAPKIGPDEIRTGYGGGFKENEGVSYKEKEDSDGEYDEFGRKKKHLRGKIPVVTSVVDSPKKPEPKPKDDDEDDDNEDDDDDDEEGGDMSAYMLSSDEEAEEEEKKEERKTDLTTSLKRSAEPIREEESKKARS